MKRLICSVKSPYYITGVLEDPVNLGYKLHPSTQDAESLAIVDNTVYGIKHLKFFAFKKKGIYCTNQKMFIAVAGFKNEPIPTILQHYTDGVHWDEGYCDSINDKCNRIYGKRYTPHKASLKEIIKHFK